MRFVPRSFGAVAALSGVLIAAFAPGAAQAGVSWSIGVGLPGVQLAVAQPQPVVYAQPAVVYPRPATAYVQPAPVVVPQQPYYVQPQAYVQPQGFYRPPVVVYPAAPAPGWYGHHHHHHHGWGYR